MPAVGTVLRADLEGWLTAQGLRVQVVGELDDDALLGAFGQEGVGFFPGPAVSAREVQRHHRVNRVGSAGGLRTSVYVLSAEQRVKHPQAVAVLRGARREVFRGEGLGAGCP